jgi:hypothetical protein
MKQSLRLSVGVAMLVGLALGGGPVFANASALPSHFHAQSMSWVSPEHGWVLGATTCGQNMCATIAGSTDGGATWHELATFNAPVTFEKRTGVTEVRFADDLHGWAFDPALWSTSDGGATWRKDNPPGGRPVIALAADADGTYAVVSACDFGQPIDQCTHPMTLWKTSGHGTWTQVSITLPKMNQAILALHGVVAYVVVPAPLLGDRPDVAADALDVTLDGSTWSPRPDPCIPAQGETLTGIAPINDTDVALLCQGNIGFGKAEKRVFRSHDTGQTTTAAGTMPLYGITTQLAATPDGVLVAASFSIGTWIYRNAGGTTWTTQEDLGDGGVGWNDVVFTTGQVGFVIHGPAAICCKGYSGQLWRTDDAGLTWAPV